jgi:hypothetical protein
VRTALVHADREELGVRPDHLVDELVARVHLALETQDTR